MRQPSQLWWGQVDSNHRSRNNRFTVCPIWPLWYIPIKKKSRRRDSNPRPTDYKSVALPAELLRLNFLDFKERPFQRGRKFNNKFYCCKKKYNFFCFFSKIIALLLFFNEIEENINLLFYFNNSLVVAQIICNSFMVGFHTFFSFTPVFSTNLSFFFKIL